MSSPPDYDPETGEILDEPKNPRIIRLQPLRALREFGAQAKPAVPNLLRLLNDRDELIRSFVTNALSTIDPEATAKAGVK